MATRTRSPVPATTLDRLVGWRAGAGLDDRQVLHALATASIERDELDVPSSLLDAVLGGRPSATIDPEVLGAHGDAAGPAAPSSLLGQAHEALLASGDRRRRGAFYTPDPIADGVVALAVGEWSAGRGPDGGRSTPGSVCDPAVGGGAFLLAAARALEPHGTDRASVVGARVHGIDVDPLAVDVVRLALALWCAEGGARADADDLVRHVVVADALAAEQAPFVDGPAAGFDLIVGNPPFLNQLEQATARTADAAESARARFGAAAHRYTDDALLFLVQACRWVRPSGIVALVQPESVLVAADADPARRVAHDEAVLRAFWWADEPVFAVPVRVCAPVFERRAAGVGPSAVRRQVGSTFADVDPLPTAPGPEAWAALVADLRGHPAVDLRDRGTVDELCTATAGFRDQFYGIVPFVREAGAADAPGGSDALGDRGDGRGRRGDGRRDRRDRGAGALTGVAPLVTAGLIEPAVSRWGSRPTRFAGQRWSAPVVDLDALAGDGDPAVAAWTAARLVPKVVVATQTKVIEAAVDERGRWYPSVPTLALELRPGGDDRDPPADRLWLVAAALLAPPVSAWAFARHGGAALSGDALKLSARQVLAAPLPADPAAWREGADHLRTASRATTEEDWIAALVAAGRALTRAHALVGTDADEVVDWWRRRLPSWHGGRRRSTDAGAVSPKSP